MKIADLHIHSRFSRATSRDLDVPQLDLWARRKGIHILGTGDFTHPAWRAELREALVPAEDGMYILREELRLPGLSAGEPPRFVISGEISSIYKKDGKVRKVHNLILLPGLDEADVLARRLEAIGNLHSDGRPILGLDCRDLLEITLEACPRAVFIPAHIWTPHFSVFGAFSGFQTLEECFGDLTEHIHALETGLSSDPDMNARVSMLDRYTLVSNSDAHSPAKLGREANLLDIDFGFDALADALEGRNPAGFRGTVEFFPEEGKYHLDGHRNCGVCLTPAETIACGFRCPVCGGKLTIGVEHRVEDLADRPAGAKRPVPFESLAPLPEVIAASTGASATGARVQRQYLDLLRTLGPEFYILRDAPLGDVGKAAGEWVQEGLRRLRAGEVVRKPGFDGQYGVIELLSPAEIGAIGGQVSLFGLPEKPAEAKKATVSKTDAHPAPAMPVPSPAPAAATLNEAQQAAVQANARITAVIAGPGTGKTQTLVSRIAHLIGTRGISPSRIVAVTFTNQAAAELKARLSTVLGGKRAIRGLTVGTFHAIALERRTARGQAGTLLAPDEARALAEQAARESGFDGPPDKFLQAVSALKNGIDEAHAGLAHEQMAIYDWKLRAAGAVDFDDLLLDELEAAQDGKAKVCHVLVDEFQDVSDTQYRLARAWSRAGTLFVIGDPDQAIYGFRGASAGCFARLAEDEPELYTVRLTQNYRAAPEIVRCAQAVIEHNPGGARPLDAMRPAGGTVRLVRAQGAGDEASFLARDIAAMVGGVDMLAAGRHGTPAAVRSFGEIAVLCRTRRQLDRIERTLGHAGIPCVVAGRGDYLHALCVHSVLCLLRFLQDPRDLLSMRAALRAIWDCPVDRIDAVASAVAAAPDAPLDTLRDRMVAYAGDGHLSLFWDELEALSPVWRKQKPVRLLEDWATHHGLTEDGDFARLIQLAAFYKDVPALLDGVLLGAEGDLRRESAHKYASGAVTLSTLHGAKGLEFGAVYLCGLTRGCVPLESGTRPNDIEEERRLFYVGMTRARDALILVSQELPSPFLSELPAGDYAEEKAGVSRPDTGAQLTLF
ncbi:UvrD-helicase domain-containing protein [Intestinibacillus sp. Marseille-P6563]|uniref:UvrD-helicase domain-containing protein n=1 Tax=Intestinibacillus sp. Marseille-P6563 TaxID=2364792 RepID=UPI000F0575A6|nr:UvrD-helicase domain-containing protein [Intestinibacillus sp. Marseille-P6563]